MVEYSELELLPDFPWQASVVRLEAQQMGFRRRVGLSTGSSLDKRFEK